MSVKIMVGGQMKVVADVISPGAITKISSLSYIYSGSEWLECDGSAISRTTYADLFAAIGTTYGSGDGVNTFNIPTQAQAIRVSFSVTSDTTFSQFTGDADIVVNNPSAAYIDISNGAAGPGIRISIIEQSAQGVTVYMDAGHTLSFTLQKGVLTFVWNGSAWQYIAGTPLRWIFTSGTSQNWKPPWTGCFLVRVLGGGGGGGGTGYNVGTEYGGGGGGGGTASRSYNLAANASCTYTVGSGGAGGAAAGGDGGAGTASTFTDGATAITGSGGGGGDGVSYGGAAFSGRGGVGSGTGALPEPGWDGSRTDPTVSGVNVSGGGGNSLYGRGAQGRATDGVGAAGAVYGGGGAGASTTSGGSNRAGGAGAAGVVIIEAAGATA